MQRHDICHVQPRPIRVICWRMSPAAPPLVGRPLDVSLDGHHIDKHFDFCAVAITVLFVIMVVIMAIALWRHRESRGAHAKYDRGSSRKAALGIALLSVGIFVAVDGVLLFEAFTDLNGRFWAWPKSAD